MTPDQKAWLLQSTRTIVQMSRAIRSRNQDDVKGDVRAMATEIQELRNNPRYGGFPASLEELGWDINNLHDQLVAFEKEIQKL